IQEILIFLSHLYPEDTVKEMLNLLEEHTSQQNLDLNSFSRLCWAIGSISGSMMKEQEIVLLVSVIERLLSCLSCTNYKHHKAVIIINFMYVVGQYPRLLSGQWKFLKVIVNKLLEFMREIHPKIRDMACITILKIVRECKEDFVIVQDGEKKPFVSELLSQLPNLIEGFESHQNYTIFESFGHMIQAEYNLQKKDEYLKILMRLLDQQWCDDESILLLKDENTIRKLVNMFQGIRSVASSLGAGIIYRALLMPQSALYLRYKDAVMYDVHKALLFFFSCTLEWKIETLDNYHEHCLNFFVLIRAIVTHCLDALVVANFQLGTRKKYCESGLTVLLEMLKQFQISEFRNKFYKKYLLSILELIFGVLTDSLHKPGFKLHVMVLHHLFCLAVGLFIAEPLWHVSNCPYRSSNEIFVRKYVTELITPFCVKVNSTANDDVNALFSSTHTADSFMRSVRNFLRQSDEFSEYDRDLFPELEEHDAAEREETRRLIRGIYNRTMKD
uniref:Exportin-1 C-terminal domain-containing protein n=1 Tax=Cannabis sativa TaxID=3483 RepID=A0A803QSF5_CANSA